MAAAYTHEHVPPMRLCKRQKSPNQQKLAAQQPGDAIENLGAGHRKLLFGRELQGVTKDRPAPRDNADLIHMIAVLGKGRGQSMADFMVGYTSLLRFTKPAAFAFRPSYHFFERILEMMLRDFVPMAAPGERQQRACILLPRVLSAAFCRQIFYCGTDNVSSAFKAVPSCVDDKIVM
jgi:hypothetical protein